ncbi:phosphatase PAP2 family protein [Corynebacterium argentoratense]|uniref:phosphatase PAP2 family protein n=1 Tax=Corynebacterium argentoratense TaxID=42817 RepID=UPI001F3A1EC7|nr:phosphatase PAP2 family protein [Corynebacterium argentoratense]MCF1766071.1 phosphatase PAP2 family protein [Corynebacterium argentoratense]
MDTAIYEWFVHHRNDHATTIFTALHHLLQPRNVWLAALFSGFVMAYIHSRRITHTANPTRTEGTAGIASTEPRWTEAAWLVIAVSTAQLLSPLLKALFGRERPPLATQLVVETNGSMPSGHVVGVAAIVTAWIFAVMRARQATISFVGYAINCTLGVAAVVLAMVDRLYLGVHWFSDTLAGAVVGIGTVLTVYGVRALLRRARRRSKSAARFAIKNRA